MTNVTFAIIVCGVIGGVFLVLALLLGGSALLAREKKEKPVAVEAEVGFFAAAETPKLTAAARTRGPIVNKYADLTDLPDKNRSRGANEISKPLSHSEIFGSLLDDDADVQNEDCRKSTMEG